MRPTKNNRKTGKYLPLDKVGDYLVERYNKTHITSQQIDFALKIVQGFSVYEAYRETYSIEELSKSSIRANAKTLISKPHIQELIRIMKSHFIQDTVIDINSILLRMEEIYDDAKTSNDYRLQLDTLKEMAKVVKDLKGEIEINNTVVRFEIQVPKVEKTIVLNDGTEKTIQNITSPHEIARMLNEYNDTEEGEEIDG